MKTKVSTLLALAAAFYTPLALAQTGNTTNAPVIAAPTNLVVECICCGVARVTVTATVADIDGDALTAVWYVNGTPYRTNDIPAGSPTTTAALSIAARLPLGTNEVMISVSDGITAPVDWITQVIVQDTTPPDIRRLVANPKVLWPPNHKMVLVRLHADVVDCTRVTNRIVRITSDEPVDDKGDGKFAPDWVICGKMSAYLRAERSGRGDGRTYTITVESTDALGNSSTARTRVYVPHDMRKKQANPRDF